MPEPIATWNSARGVWERAEINILCEHSALYSQTLPTSGSMRNGRLYPRQRQGLPISASESSSSPGLCTPTGRDWKGSGAGVSRNRHGINDLAEQIGILFATPQANLATNGGSQPPAKRLAGGHAPTLADEVEHLLPTPRAALHGAQDPQARRAANHAVELNDIVTHLLPTPRAADGMSDSMEAARGRLERGSRFRGTTEEAISLLPTPRASHSEEDQDSWETRQQRMAEGYGWRKNGLPLGNAVRDLLPTPSANQYEQENWQERREALKAKGINGNGFGLTTAMAITELTGGATPPPSPGGRKSSDGQLPGQLSLDGLDSG